MVQPTESFPLFPLGLVLLPGELVPLHIFEERYKLMVGACLEQDSEFGIIWLSDEGLKDVGCAARITRVLERFEDGRLNILVEGTQPFRLTRRIEDLPYPAGHVEPLADEDDSESRPEPDALAELDAYGMAATLEVAPAAKQSLLELRSESGRLEQLEGLFVEALQRIRMAERAAERASGNGHQNG